MVQLTNILMALLAASSATSALAAHRPIRQRIADSTRPWKEACKKANGGPWCHAVSKAASLSLRSCSAPCEQQDAADMMVDVAKTLNNNTDMIRLSQLFVQQPRDSSDGLQVPYCQKAPRNAELHGFYHCQFSGTDFTKFGGNLTSLPPGVSAIVPPGSCPAHNTSVPNGKQLNKLAESPGKPISRGVFITLTTNETFAHGCPPDADDDDDHPHLHPFHHNWTHPAHDTNNTHPGEISPSTFLRNETDPTPSGNVSTSSPVKNGTAPGNITSLFSNLLAGARTPGNILRRAEESGVKDAKPGHIRSKSNRVKPRPKHEHKHAKPTRPGRKHHNKHGRDQPKLGYEKAYVGPWDFPHGR